jgi:hypothetical protein
MKLPPVSWAFFGLAVAILVGYLLTIGIFAGTEVTSQRVSDGLLYSKECRYLYLNGTRLVFNNGAVGRDREEVEDSSEGFCPPFWNNQH